MLFLRALQFCSSIPLSAPLVYILENDSLPSPGCCADSKRLQLLCWSRTISFTNMIELLYTISTEVYFPASVMVPFPHLNIKCFFWCHLIDNTYSSRQGQHACCGAWRTALHWTLDGWWQSDSKAHFTRLTLSIFHVDSTLAGADEIGMDLKIKSYQY